MGDNDKNEKADWNISSSPGGRSDDLPPFCLNIIQCGAVSGGPAEQM